MGEENPYRPPAGDPSVAPERCEYKDLDTKTLKRLRNHSHTVRTIGALGALGILVGPAIVFFSPSESSFAVVTGVGIGILVLGGLVVYGCWWRPSWGRIPGTLYCILSLVGFPIGTAIGVFGLIAFGSGAALFGPARYRHSILESEWKYRKKHRIA
jgi:hypothetical protein